MSRVIATDESLVEASTSLPISVEWVKLHIKAVSNREDLLIESWIKAAAQTFEMTTGHQILQATWDYFLDGYPDALGRIQLPRPPLMEVTSVQHLSEGDYVAFSDGGSPEVQSWSSKAFRGVPARRGWIEPLSGMVWPIVTIAPAAVAIRYTAGYATNEGDVPDVIKTVLGMLVGSFEQFRSEVHLSDRSSKLEKLPFGCEQLMRPFIATAMDRQQLRTSL